MRKALMPWRRFSLTPPGDELRVAAHPPISCLEVVPLRGIRHAAQKNAFLPRKRVKTVPPAGIEQTYKRRVRSGHGDLPGTPVDEEDAIALLRLLSSLTPERVTSASPRPEPRRKIPKVGDTGLEPVTPSLSS